VGVQVRSHKGSSSNSGFVGLSRVEPQRECDMLVAHGLSSMVPCRFVYGAIDGPGHEERDMIWSRS
jgi:hypothetical protein